MFKFTKKERSTSSEKEMWRKKEEEERRRRREREKKKRPLVEWVWLDRDNSGEWVPPDWFFYHYVIETQFSTSENTKLVFSVFITLTQKFWVWVMKTRLGNQAKQKKIVWVSRFLITQLWVLDHIAQNSSKPNRP